MLSGDGFQSRFVTCMPWKMVNDCHVINVVYSATLDKWVWVDPTFDAYVVDEERVMLSIQEVRERMRDGRPYFLNEDANWNNESPQTQKHYLDTYMAKNLYYLVCSDRSEFDTETWCEGKHPIYYVALIPEGYDCDREYHFHDDQRQMSLGHRRMRSDFGLRYSEPSPDPAERVFSRSETGVYILSLAGVGRF